VRCKEGSDDQPRESDKDTMTLLPQTVVDILLRGGSARVPAKRLFPNLMKQFAHAASVGGGFIEIVDNATLLPATINEITNVGQGHILWDFVTKSS
jgi:hypothetical protein